MTSPFDDPYFNRTLFFPRRDPGGTPPGAEDLLVPVGDGAEVHVRIHGTARADLSLVFFHGNGEIVADYDPLAAHWAGEGVALVACEYRGYGKSTGTPTLRSVLADAGTVWRHLTESGVLRERVIVMGRSLGSAPAIELAAGEPGIDGLVIESGFADPLGLLARRGIVLDRIPDADRALFDNAAKISRVRIPTLVLHGADDDLLSPEEGRALHRAAGAAEKRLVLLPGVGHNDILFGAFDDWAAAQRDLFDRVRAEGERT